MVWSCCCCLRRRRFRKSRAKRSRSSFKDIAGSVIFPKGYHVKPVKGCTESWYDLEGPKEFQNIDGHLNKPDLADKMKAYDDLKNLLKTQPKNPEVLWRLAKACHGISVAKGAMMDEQSKKLYLDEAIEHATLCLELSPRQVESHKWYAICVGARSEFLPIKDKIKGGITFKEHIEEALKMNPNDPTLHHLLGRFRYEVATLTWIERRLAKTLFGEVPYSTCEESLSSLMKVESLVRIPWKENRLIIARNYIHLENYPLAIEWLEKAREVEVTSFQEGRMDIEINNLLEKYHKYRK